LGSIALASILLIIPSSVLWARPGVFKPKDDPAGPALWGGLRFRHEFQDNFNLKSYGDSPVVGDEEDNFLLGRLRLGIKGRLYKNVFFSAGIQHAEVWGMEINESQFFKKSFDREHNPYEDDWEPFNTYLRVKDLFSLPLDLKVGRQLIYFGDKRIFGPGQWGNTGRWWWDAARAHFHFDDHFIDLFYGNTVIHDPDVISTSHNHGFESTGLYAHFQPFPENKNIVIEPFFMTKDSDGNEFTGENGQTDDLEAWYAGFRIAEQDHKKFDWDLTYILERGDHAGDDLAASGYHLQLAYNFNDFFLKPRLGADYSYSSGDEDPDDGDRETFDGAFGARDKMYGRMNLFHWKNLKDAQLHLTLHPHKDWRIVTRWHHFRLAEREDAWYLNPKAYRDPTGASGDEVGRELDIIGRWQVSSQHQIQCGFGYFWPDEFAEKQDADKDAAWAFVQWQWKFSQPLDKLSVPDF